MKEVKETNEKKVATKKETKVVKEEKKEVKPTVKKEVENKANKKEVKVEAKPTIKKEVKPVAKKEVEAKESKKETKATKQEEIEIVENVESAGKTQSSRPKVYHISIREDGKWQVKFAKGEKVIKTFATQLEAIDYAKQLANNQNGSIAIHKKDGKIRKQKYKYDK